MHCLVAASEAFWFFAQMANVYSFAVWQVRPIWLFQRWACLERQLSDAPTLQVSVRVGVPRIQQGTGRACLIEKLKNEVKLCSEEPFNSTTTSRLNMKFNILCVWLQVELPVADPDAVFDPSDADHTWNAKVMLMAVPNPEELYVKTCQMGDSSKFIQWLIHLISAFLATKLLSVRQKFRHQQFILSKSNARRPDSITYVVRLWSVCFQLGWKHKLEGFMELSSMICR